MIKSMMFRSPDGDVSGGDEPRGTAIFDPIPEEKVDDKEGVGAKGAETDKEEKVETPPTTTVDAAALAKEFGTVLSEHFKKEEPPTKKIDDLTPEEAKKLLNVWEPTKEWQTKFDNLETREAALAEMRDGVVKHTDTITQYRVREAMTGMNAKIDPVLAFIQSQQNEQAETRLKTRFPDLAKPGMDDLISAVSAGLIKQGKKYEKEDDLFGDIAKGVEKVIQIHDPKFKLSTGSNPEIKPKTKPANAIPVTTSGSGGGTGGGGGEGPAKPRGIAIFD